MRSDEFRGNCVRYLSGWLSFCAGAISGELPNRSITDLITPVIITSELRNGLMIGSEPR